MFHSSRKVIGQVAVICQDCQESFKMKHIAMQLFLNAAAKYVHDYRQLP